LARWVGVRVRASEDRVARFRIRIDRIDLALRGFDGLRGGVEDVSVLDQIAAEFLQFVKGPVQLGLERWRAFRRGVQIVDF